MRNSITEKAIKVAKKVFNQNINITHSDYNDKNFSPALNRLTKYNIDLLNTRAKIGARKDGKPFYPAINKMENAFNFLRVDLYNYGDPKIPDISEYDGLHSGTPMKTKAFKPCLKKTVKTTKNKNLFWYPSTVGNLKARQNIVNYLVKEGFKLEKQNDYDGLGVENIVFTCSTTHAYTMILNLIAKDEDVILMTGPNYGLFAIEPERINAHVEIIDLEEKDNWYINPQSLEEKIIKINKELALKFENKLDYTPKVVAFLNMNPHNPLGKVISKKNKEILEGIGDVCLKQGVFVIDDLIYRDLTFDQNNLALPMAIYPKYFNNTISLFGISKAYGLASFRAGFIVAPIPICRGIANNIFQMMDSVPVLQVESVVGAFNGTNSRYNQTKKYFKKIINEYKYRYNLLLALIYGINNINNEALKNKIKKDIDSFEKDTEIRKMLYEGIPEVEIRKKTDPESGFFAILDFTKLKGKKFDNTIINNDLDILKYFYIKGKVKCIMGMNMSWPNENELIARINFAIEKKALINNFKIIKKSIKELK